ncbi:MAG: hypothetical protein ACOC31_03645 [Bacteroidota bacterium]
MKTKQYNHLLQNDDNIQNNQVWIPSGAGIKPSNAHQFTLDWKGRLNGGFSAEATLFYKTMNDLTTYKEGYASLIGDLNWQSKLETGGKGVAYGFEAMIKKETGAWTGFASYAYTRSTRKYDEINAGKAYTFDFERPHSFSLNVNRKINDKLNLNVSWVYQTGLPYTPAIGRQYTTSGQALDGYSRYEFYEALIYGERNSARMRDYHRMDVGLTYSKKSRSRGHSILWNFAIYNIYNRQNPYYYYYNDGDGIDYYDPSVHEKTGNLALYQVCNLPIIPTVSWKIIFDGKNPRPGNFGTRFKKWLYYEYE